MGAVAGEPLAKAAGEVDGRKHSTAAPVVDTQPVWEMKGKLNGVKVGAKEKRAWNTKNLARRIMVDGMSAATAAGLVAPVIAILDKSIMENASGKRGMTASLKASFTSMLLRPHLFIVSKPFALILCVYGGTYFIANSLDTFKATTKDKRASITTNGPAKFVATSAANLGLSLYKDSQFAKMFGTVAARPIPGASYALFAARDCLTIFASFNLPPLLAPSLPISESAEKYISRASAAQFLAPAALQLVSTPFHLLGLDLYNRNGGTPFLDRMRKVRVDWLQSSLARMCRIIPAFGVGGVVNNGMRSRFMKALE